MKISNFGGLTLKFVNELVHDWMVMVICKYVIPRLVLDATIKIKDLECVVKDVKFW